jgi:ubiquinone/menaquinone biosynthesis C-methylase UbiE
MTTHTLINNNLTMGSKKRSRQDLDASPKKKHFQTKHKLTLSKNKKIPADDADKNKDANAPKETWSKSKKKRMRALMAKQKKQEMGKTGVVSSGRSAATDSSSSSKKKDKKDTVDDNSKKPKSSLQDAFKARLSGSRFRILNEELYTTTSQESLKRFSENPELFEQYHEGFRHQVEAWPVNPVDVIVRWLSNKYQRKNCVVADFGCGDAQLAKDLLNVKGNGMCPFTVHSFDLVTGGNDLVTACDMADVPLPDKSVDVCVFCLSLMGTNLADFIREAYRVLKDDGRVKIAEVRSRIEYSHAPSQKKNNDPKAPKEKTAGTLSEFIDVLEELGFECVKTDRSNKMFLLLELRKSGKRPNKKLEFSAKPCIYKRR